MADPKDAPLSAAQRSRIRRLSQFKEPDPGEEAGELNIVPYLDIITNIMMFVLASISVSFIGSIDTTPPSIGGGKVRVDPSQKALNLAAFVVSGGITLKTSGGQLDTGCDPERFGSGITIPKRGADYDFRALTDCARKIKNFREDFKDEVQVTITANPDIGYGTIIGTMDALRSDGQEDLFPEVHFGAVK